MWCCALVRGTRRWHSPCTTPTVADGSGCTFASTSAPRLSGDRPGDRRRRARVRRDDVGTAVANLGPAVVEANYARVPLIVLSANRPYELLGTGANQTMEQLGYFGTQVRATISLAWPRMRPNGWIRSTQLGGRRPAE